MITIQLNIPIFWIELLFLSEGRKKSFQKNYYYYYGNSSFQMIDDIDHHHQPNTYLWYNNRIGKNSEKKNNRKFKGVKLSCCLFLTLFFVCLFVEWSNKTEIMLSNEENATKLTCESTHRMDEWMNMDRF